jgi:hypothetical protein
MMRFFVALAMSQTRYASAERREAHRTSHLDGMSFRPASYKCGSHHSRIPMLVKSAGTVSP